MLGFVIFDVLIVSNFRVMSFFFSSDHYVHPLRPFFYLVDHLLAEELWVDNFRFERMRSYQQFFFKNVFTFMNVGIELCFVLDITPNKSSVRIYLKYFGFSIQKCLLRIFLSKMVVLNRRHKKNVLFLCVLCFTFWVSKAVISINFCFEVTDWK